VVLSTFFEPDERWACQLFFFSDSADIPFSAPFPLFGDFLSLETLFLLQKAPAGVCLFLRLGLRMGADVVLYRLFFSRPTSPPAVSPSPFAVILDRVNEKDSSCIFLTFPPPPGLSPPPSFLTQPLSPPMPLFFFLQGPPQEFS